MNIRLIASDMDGTLLNPHSEISAANIAAVKEAQRQGVEFLICSGRDYSDAKSIVEACGITCGYICLSGAMVYDVNGNLLIDLPLTGKEAATVEKLLSTSHASMDLLTSHGRFTTSSKEEKFESFYRFFNGFQPFDGPVPKEIRERAAKRLNDVQFIQSLGDVPENVRIYKICSNDLSEETVKQLKREFAAYPEIAAASSFPTNIELTGTRAQKGHALKAYAALKGISLDDIMVIGDSDNDLSMFIPEFGWTVAMENSMDCIRDAAKYHTRSNGEDGVAWAVSKYVLQNNV